MAFAQSDLDRIDAAIASGVRSVTFADGRRTEYQDLEAMLKAREAIGKEIVAASGGMKRRSVQVRVTR